MDKDKLLQIITDQQKEIKSDLFRIKLISREQEQVLLQIMDKSPIKVIMGIRHSGKSTLLLQAIQKKNCLYFNFDEEVLSQIPADELSLLLELGQRVIPDAEYLIFDEIQNIQGWELFINKIHRKKMNIFMTGSNSRLLSSELATHLTGRQLTLELFPFSFSEYLQSSNESLPTDHFLSTDEKILLKNKFLLYMNGSAFPEIIHEEPESRFFKMYLKELYDKIIHRDLAQRRRIKNLKSLKEISLQMLSLYSAQFTFQSVKKISSIQSVNTVKNYIEYLQEAYMGFVLEPFSFKIKERISLPKKYYVIDPSFVEVIAGRMSTDRGKKIENIIFIELKRRGHEIYYFKQPHYKIDFLIREGKNIVELIQVCWTFEEGKTREREVKALHKASQELKCKKLTLITFEEEMQITDDHATIKVVPAWKWLLDK